MQGRRNRPRLALGAGAAVVLLAAGTAQPSTRPETAGGTVLVQEDPEQIDGQQDEGFFGRLRSALGL